MVMGSMVLGLVGCIVGCTATSVNALIGANLCNGIAAAGQLSFGIVLGELVPNKMRGPIVTLVFMSSTPFASKSPYSATLCTKANEKNSFRPVNCSSILSSHRAKMEMELLPWCYHVCHSTCSVPSILPPAHLRSTPRPGQVKVATIQGA